MAATSTDHIGTSKPGVTRRRALGIFGCAAGMLGAGGSLAAVLSGASPATSHRWRGVVLGASASLVLVHEDPVEARRIIAACLAEIARLERIFSLYRNDTALVRLNRDGALDAPPADLLRLLSLARRIHQASGGAFDPTVQPLWRLYAEHFAQANADPAGPSSDAIAAARRHVGFDQVALVPGRITLGRPGMALTLNGVAQGYIADRVAALMRSRGVADTLIDMGELRALGRHGSGRPWRAGIADPRQPGRTVASFDLNEGALATSGDYGTRFDRAGRFTHILDPRSGCPARHHRSVSVAAGSAALADALSTGMFAMRVSDGHRMLKKFSHARALVVRKNGSLVTLS